MLLSLFPHLCFKVTPWFHIVSLISCLFILVGIFHYKNLACILQWWTSSICPRSSWASKLDAHQLSFFLKFHTLIALGHLLHGNPYSSCWHQLMRISIARWLSSSMWDFLLFCLLHTITNLYSIPPVVLYPWLKLMYCVKVEKVWDYLSTKQLLGLSSGV